MHSYSVENIEFLKKVQYNGQDSCQGICRKNIWYFLRGIASFPIGEPKNRSRAEKGSVKTADTEEEVIRWKNDIGKSL